MKRKSLRIAIDLDDTVFNWGDAHEAYYKCRLSELSDSQITEQVNRLRLNKQFWSNLELLERPDFEYSIICTKRVNPKSYTRACLEKHGLPVKPIFQLYSQADNKGRVIKGRCDVLIDDSWFNVQQCLSVGVPALLITRPHNKHIKTPYRVDHLCYAEIEQKYNELFR